MTSVNVEMKINLESAPATKIHRGSTTQRAAANVEYTAEGLRIFGHKEIYEILGQSPCMRNLFQHFIKVCATDLNIVIEGERGTGKNLIARALVCASPFADKPCITVDCHAATTRKLDTILFGPDTHEATDSDSPQLGALQLARGGTLILIAPEELPKHLQARLVRILEGRAPGHDREPLNVRVLSITRRSLRTETRHGHFNRVLLDALSEDRLRVPSLRERKEDLPLLVANLMRKQPGRTPSAPFTSAKLKDLETYFWSDNVRELKALIEHNSIALA
jgi:DNA-binding NtrC family response regulator